MFLCHHISRSRPRLKTAQRVCLLWPDSKTNARSHTPALLSVSQHTTRQEADTRITSCCQQDLTSSHPCSVPRWCNHCGNSRKTSQRTDSSLQVKAFMTQLHWSHEGRAALDFSCFLVRGGGWSGIEFSLPVCLIYTLLMVKLLEQLSAHALSLSTFCLNGLHISAASPTVERYMVHP